MKINGLVVSVNYSEQLAHSIDLWMGGLESLMVVTDFDDNATARMAHRHGATVCRTDAFYLDGAHFNKGRAMEQARATMPWSDWILFFDADVIPPADWKQRLEDIQPAPGNLYGCWRYDERGARIPDDCHGYGYFQLFHSADPIAQTSPLIDRHWPHAGNSDSFLMLRWKNAGRLAPVLSFGLTHPGGPDHNWFGVGRQELFQEMVRGRMRRGGGWESIEAERIPVQ